MKMATTSLADRDKKHRRNSHFKCYTNVFISSIAGLALAATLHAHTELDNKPSKQENSGTAPTQTETAISKSLLRKTPYMLRDKSGSVNLHVIAYRDAASEDTAIAEIELAPGFASPKHTHQSHEWIYVLNGTILQTVAGVDHTIRAGEISIVRPKQEVIHRVIGDKPAKLLLIWRPASEVDSLLKNGFTMIDVPPNF